MNDSNSEIGTAIVTSCGIQFCDKIYSATKAIEEQWFEKAHVFSSWFVTVAFKPEDLTVLYMYHHDEIIECREIVLSEFSDSKLEKYFKSIQRMKRQKSKVRFPKHT